MIVFVFCSRVFGTNLEVFEQFKESFASNGGFPVNNHGGAEEILQSAPYDKIYVYVDPDDFASLVALDGRNKLDIVVASGFVIHGNDKDSSPSLHHRVSNNLFLPDITLFTGDMRLRGGLSLDCPKPSFRLSNDTIDYKLKGSCGASFGVEERLFGALVDNISSPMVHPYHVFFKEQIDYILYVNGQLYGLYLDVPNFDKEYFLDTKVVDPSKSDNCIFKVGRFVLPSKTGTGISLTSRLEKKYDTVSDKDIDFVMENTYGNKDCTQKAQNLLSLINQEKPRRDDIKKMVHVESILLWGMILRHTDNHISFTHNYLLLEHKGKFAGGFRDVENFQGCKMQDIDAYRDSDNREYNLLFSHVLRRYQQNDPDRILFFEEMIKEKMCNVDQYHSFKNTYVSYVIADRYIWNAGHITPVTSVETSVFAQQYLTAYQQKIDYRDFFKEQYTMFDSYFGFDKRSILGKSGGPDTKKIFVE